MIKYSLQCGKGHEFEAWFPSSAAFDKQARRGLVACARCGDTRVSKSLMAPNLSPRTRKRREIAAPAPAGNAPAAAQSLQASASPEQREMLALLRKLKAEVVAKSEYVGPRFAEEARKIHHEEAPARGIYGEASREEVEALHSDGVECYPLPVLPEEKN
jgi:hypothetical protein